LGFSSNLTSIAGRLPRGAPVSLLVGVVVGGLAFEHGTYDTSAWTAVGIVATWALGIGWAMGLWQTPDGRASRLALGVLLGFALWTAASALWGENAETSIARGAQALVYAAVLALALVVPRPRTSAMYVNGIALGIVGIEVLALLSRFIPGLVEGDSIAPFLGSQVAARLSYPIGYWNALGILAGLGMPCLLRIATSAETILARSLAASTLPLAGVVAYLASSRSGFATIVVSAAVFVALTPRRWTAAFALAVTAAADAAAFAYLRTRHELVSGPLSSVTAASQGHRAVAVVVACCTCGAIVFAAWAPYCDRARLPRHSGVAATALLIVATVGGLIAVHPMRQISSFTKLPTTHQVTDVQAHLVNANGNYRWQYWKSTLDEASGHLIVGRGAGAWEAWWAEHGNVPGFVSNPHSLYFESLGDLGIVGLVLSALFFVGVSAALIRKASRDESNEGVVAACASGFIAFAFACGVDWVWNIPAIAAVGVLFAGFGLASRATAGHEEPTRRSRLPRLLAATAAAAALLVVFDVYAVDQALQSSRRAVASGAFETALSRADDAHRLAPWASSPVLQRALVLEAAGKLSQADSAINDALALDHRNWRLWLIYSRIEVERGRIKIARAALGRAAKLNPTSPVFRSLPAKRT
jgi:hypothetical protein